MNNYILAHKVRVEIEKLNKNIDSRIIRGLSYKKEARRHKVLVAELNHINGLVQSSNTGFFRRLSGVFASFVL